MVIYLDLSLHMCHDVTGEVSKFLWNVEGLDPQLSQGPRPLSRWLSKYVFLKVLSVDISFITVRSILMKILLIFDFMIFNLGFFFSKLVKNMTWFSKCVFWKVVYVHVSFMSVRSVWMKLWLIFDFIILNFVICLKIVKMSKQTLDDSQNMYF